MKVKSYLLSFILIVGVLTSIFSISKLNFNNYLENENLIIETYEPLPDPCPIGCGSVDEEAMQKNFDVFEVDISNIDHYYNEEGNPVVSGLTVSYDETGYDQTIDYINSITIFFVSETSGNVISYKSYINDPSTVVNPDTGATTFEVEIDGFLDINYTIKEISISYVNLSGEVVSVYSFLTDSNLTSSTSGSITEYATGAIPGGIFINDYTQPNWIYNPAPYDASNEVNFDRSYVFEDLRITNYTEDAKVYYSVDNQTWSEANILINDNFPQDGGSRTYDIEIGPLEPNTSYPNIYLTTDPLLGNGQISDVKQSKLPYQLITNLQTGEINEIDLNGGNFNADGELNILYSKDPYFDTYNFTISLSKSFYYPYSWGYENSLFYQPQLSFDGGNTWQEFGNINDSSGNPQAEIEYGKTEIFFSLDGSEVSEDKIYYEDVMFRMNDYSNAVTLEPWYDYSNIELELIDITTTTATFAFPDVFNQEESIVVDYSGSSSTYPELDFDKGYRAVMQDGRYVITLDDFLPGKTYNPGEPGNGTWIWLNWPGAPNIETSIAPFYFPLPEFTTLEYSTPPGDGNNNNNNGANDNNSTIIIAAVFGSLGGIAVISLGVTFLSKRKTK